MPNSSLVKQLPALRRYARALLGAQQAGDVAVRETLEAMLDGRVEVDVDASPRVALYRAFHQLRMAGRDGTASTEGQPELRADQRLQSLELSSRMAFLLTAMEGFSYAETARILGLGMGQVEAQVMAAQSDIDRQTATRVLIIEDEWLIALDLKTLVGELGHEVVGVAPTRSRAVEMAREGGFGLVLADIQLADGSSGIDAVGDILSSFNVPVIFITAFPDRLLTGERPEPTYLIAKPFLSETVKATIAQALFFHEAERAVAKAGSAGAQEIGRFS
ncbi:response regulator [Xanthobacter sp. TB0139]|uniref:response regulator n=1 Tax=Xanthobacter sp. TB0139 TaxID=3459178 RepID=UPI004039D3DD